MQKKEENSNQRIIEKYKSKEQNIRKRKRGYDDSQKILDANIKKLKENHKSETEKHESEKEKIGRRVNNGVNNVYHLHE